MNQSNDKDLYSRRGSDDFKAEEELLIKKRKMLEDKAPGLFDYLTKLTAEEASTETASSHSGEQDTDEIKHTIHIPTPCKSQGRVIQNNLSNVVRVDPQKMVCQFLPRIETDNEIKSFEDKQRQQMSFLNAQNTLMLTNVNAQTDNLMMMARQCIETLRNMKGGIEETQASHMQRMEVIRGEKKNSSNFDSNPTSLVLFNHLFGAKNLYKYELVLDRELPVPIFRERNLIIKAKLVDILTKEPVKNHNKVLLQLVLQTWEVPSTTILRNKTGNKAVMGETEVELKNGEVVFDRIQINEVTSKFIHGHVAMLIVPAKPANHGTSLSDQERVEGYVNFDQIKPFMLEKVVVKSKKKKNPKKKVE